jgi:predicted Zn-dependent peptidase
LRQTVETVDQVIARLDAVTVEQVQSVAQQLFRQDELRLAIIGPFDHTDLFDRVLQLP